MKTFELTSAQKQIIRLLREGMHVPEIAERMGLKRQTIKRYLHETYLILGVDGLIDLAVLTASEVPLDSPLRLQCVEKNQ